VVYDGNVVSFVDEVGGYGGADLAGPEYDDFHRGLFRALLCFCASRSSDPNIRNARTGILKDLAR
jgi:hypothetical protein